MIRICWVRVFLEQQDHDDAPYLTESVHVGDVVGQPDFSSLARLPLRGAQGQIFVLDLRHPSNSATPHSLPLIRQLLPEKPSAARLQLAIL